MKTGLKKLLVRHRYAREKKAIGSTASLLQAVRLDLVKAYFVLVEIHNRTAVDVVCEFFADYPGIVPEILPKLDQPRLHHLGFEVHEPHDLVLPGFYRWTKQFSRWLDIPIRINGTLRFPSPTNFQERVGAYTEMMQISVEPVRRTSITRRCQPIQIGWDVRKSGVWLITNSSDLIAYALDIFNHDFDPDDL